MSRPSPSPHIQTGGGTAGAKIAALGRRTSYGAGILAVSFLIVFTAQGTVLGAAVAIAGVAAATWITTLISLPVWVWRMARLLAAASASTAGLLLSTTMGLTLARNDISKDDSLLVTYLAMTVFLAAVAMWTGDLRIAHRESRDADARHTELLTAIAAAHGAKPSRRLPRPAIFLALTGVLLLGIKRRSRR